MLQVACETVHEAPSRKLSGLPHADVVGSTALVREDPTLAHGASRVRSNGTVVNDGGANPASGHSLIEAPSTDDALAKAKRCPILAAGGSIELAEALDMDM